MKVAVIFIGTEKYLNFLPSWYESCEKFLLPGVEKKYAIFTDGEIPEAPDNAVIYKQEHLEWPYITLYRFKMIRRCFDDIKDCDWLLFLDADMRVVDTVNPEELFDDTKKYIGVHHPCHFLGMNPHKEFPGAFETNAKSTAKVPDDYDFKYYWQGCLWGGRVPEVIDMMEELDSRTKQDEENDFIAQWHDESQLNAFYAQRPDDVHTLGSQFAYPEVFAGFCEFDPVIVHLAKDNSKYQV